MRIYTTAFIAITLATFALNPAQSKEPTIAGLAQVIDGDSIVIGGKQIRLLGVDAPEWDQTCPSSTGKLQAGSEATAWLRSRLEARTVSCSVESKDRYGRLLATCYLDGENINSTLVAAGWAMAYRHYSERYTPQETVAKQAKKGIWIGDCAPPWEYRRKK
jgi:endonuclease YncB( thermonuclease family)